MAPRKDAAAADVTQRGVTLGWLLDFACYDHFQPAWTIQDLVDKWIRPVTAPHKCCLWDIVSRKCTGKPQFFISHTW